MLQTSGIYIIKDGVELDSKPDREGATQFAAISNLHKIVDSILKIDSGLSILKVRQALTLIEDNWQKDCS
ncbi:MAG: hypothetical protein HY756_01325 [Nitrospirae bacterium]|nr:hypothetical protein [Nitrospirota bacterium]